MSLEDRLARLEQGTALPTREQWRLILPRLDHDQLNAIKHRLEDGMSEQEFSELFERLSGHRETVELLARL